MTTDRRVEFISAFQRLQNETHSIAKAHGFQEHVGNPLFTAARLGLIMSEAAEAMEWDRMGKTEELPHELADIVIRCMDLAESLSIDLATAIVDKSEFNAGRPYKHGGKLY